MGSFVVAMLIAMVAAVRSGWIPFADEALIELRVRDVPSHLPLVGVYSRFGWNHPGPTQFYLLAPFYWIGRSSSSALVVGTLTFHTTFGLLAWWAARRIDRLTGLLVLAASVALVASTHGFLVRTPWNPYLVLLGGVALVSLAWSSAERETLGLILFLPIASLLIQTHIVSAPAIVLTVVAAAAVMISPRRSDSLPIPWTSAAIGVSIALLLWVPPLIQQLAGENGNLNLLVENGGGEGRPAGISASLGSLSQAFGPWPSGLRSGDVYDVVVDTSYVVPIWLVIPILGLWLSVRNHNWRFVRGLAICAASLAGVTISVAMITGGVFKYLTVVSRPLVAATLAIGLGSILVNLSDRILKQVRWAVCAVVIGLSIAVGVSQIRADNPADSYAPTVSALTEAVESEASSGSISIGSEPDPRSVRVTEAVMLQLERDGHVVGNPAAGANVVGAHRTEGESEYSIFIAPVGMVDQLTEDGWTILRVYQPLTRAEAEEIADLEDEEAALRESLESAPESPEPTEVTYRLLEIVERVREIEDGRVPMLVAGRPTL